MGARLITELDTTHIEQLWHQLQEEHASGEIGFYCNRQLIAEAIEDRRSILPGG